MHNPEFYSKITLKELKDILRGNNGVDIPLLTERLNCLHEVGKILIDKFDGSRIILLFTVVFIFNHGGYIVLIFFLAGYFINCIKKCNKNAQSLLHLVTSEFPCFNDIASYKGESGIYHF